VRCWAENRKLPVAAPESINLDESVQLLENLRPDLLVVCDYGQILKPAPLSVAGMGGINLHGSLLPAYRGAAPVQWAVLNGDLQTGVSVIHMTPRLDAGPVISRRSTPIGSTETAGELEARLARLGVEATLEAVAALVAARDEGRSVTAVPQDSEMASRAPRLAKTDGRILWTRSAKELDCHVRGMQPWPGAFTELAPPADKRDQQPTRLMVTAISPTDQPVELGTSAGTVRIVGERLFVAGGDYWLSLERVKPAGKKEMTVAEWLRGRPIRDAATFR
jgi:methionyl-tRNA formyltransferase